MKCLAVISVFVGVLGLSQGKPAPEGVGAFAFQDSSGRRYGGTYGLKDGKVYGISGDDVSKFNIDGVNQFQSLDSFFPEYFRNFDTIIREAFADHIRHQQVALDAARQAFDITSNRAGYIPNFGFESRSGFGGVPDFGSFGFGMPFGPTPPFGFPMGPIGPLGPMGPNSAFAGAMAGPGIQAHKITLNPESPNKPNVDVTKLSDPNALPSGRRFYSVSSSSFSSSNNVNGMQQTSRGGKTVVNDNGVVSSYDVTD